jgi:hypothetical protein
LWFFANCAMDCILWAKVEHCVHIWETNNLILKIMESKWTQNCPSELKFSAMKLKSVMSLGWLNTPPVSFTYSFTHWRGLWKMSIQLFRAKELRS